MGRKLDCMLPVTVRRNSECGHAAAKNTEHYVMHMLLIYFALFFNSLVRSYSHLCLQAYFNFRPGCSMSVAVAYILQLVSLVTYTGRAKKVTP